MIAAFCERIGYTSLELLVSHFQGRVLHGVKDDLVDLTHLKGVRGSTARLLYTAGLETVECIAESTRDEIHAALCQGKRSNEQQGEWKKAGMILKSAIELLQVCSIDTKLFRSALDELLYFEAESCSCKEVQYSGMFPETAKQENIGGCLFRRELMLQRTPSMKPPDSLIEMSTRTNSLPLHTALVRDMRSQQAPPMVSPVLPSSLQRAASCQGRQARQRLRNAPCKVMLQAATQPQLLLHTQIIQSSRLDTSGRNLWGAQYLTAVLAWKRFQF